MVSDLWLYAVRVLHADSTELTRLETEILRSLGTPEEKRQLLDLVAARRYELRAA